MAKFDAIQVVEGELYEVTGEDGIEYRFDYFIGILVGSRRFVHPFGYTTRAEAEVRKAHIETVDEVDLDLWIEQDEMSLEEKFDLYAEREQEVRLGFRSEDDMYHGIPR